MSIELRELLARKRAAERDIQIPPVDYSDTTCPYCEGEVPDPIPGEVTPLPPRRPCDGCLEEFHGVSFEDVEERRELTERLAERWEGRL